MSSQRIKMAAVEVSTQELDINAWPPSYRRWIYCALDNCVTFEVDEHLDKLFDEHSSWAYSFEHFRMGPVAMSMMLRGIRIDNGERLKLLTEYKSLYSRLENFLDQMAMAIWNKPLNARSPDQLKEFFYERLKIPPIYKNDKGVKKVTTDISAMEKLQDFFYARPFAKCILAIRDVGKLIDVVASGIDPDGRMRMSFNPSGTETQRWSSSKNVARGGLNAQNITDRMRRIFISDEGMKLAYVDLEQAESRAVAYLADDPAYIEACESSDLHTEVAKMIWTEVKWSNDPAENRQIADQPFYRHFSMRDFSKRAGHATNYLIKPFSLAKKLKIEQEPIERFQQIYLKRAFPGIRRFHHEIAQELQDKGYLVTPAGHCRHFHGRLWEEATIREAVAYKPQQIVAWFCNEGVARVFEYLEREVQRVTVHAQVHDAGLFQFYEDDRDAVPEIQKTMESVELLVSSGKVLRIPTDAKVGYNWATAEADNLSGLTKFGKDRDQIREYGNPLQARL